MLLSSPDSVGYIPKRIVSLVPSQTELLHYFGLEEETVGITKFCVHPETWFRTKTRVGGTKSVNIEKVKQLQPDLIIANKEENVKQQVEELAGEFPVWVTDVNNLDDALQMITDIGRLTNTETKAFKLSEEIKNNFTRLPDSDRDQLQTAYLIWRKPYMTAGGDTFINDMLMRCGFNNIFGKEKRYPEITISQLQTANLPTGQAGCKLLLLSSEPYPFKQQHIDELQKELPGTRIVLVDGEMFSWYGSRLLLASGYFEELQQQLLS